MKTTLKLYFLFLVSVGFAQAPSGYYSTATGSGYTLKTQLYNIIKGHTDRGYTGLWTTYSTSDRDHQYENDNSIIDIYSENPSGADPYKYTYSTNQCGTYSIEGDCYNREHIVPQSTFNQNAPMVSDAHHIPPTDGKVNGLRSNYPHGNVATASSTTRNGGKLGASAVSGYTGTVFEPINEFKGDVARMYFYFATRYENTVASYSYDMFNGTSNQVFTTAFLNMLISWHNADPVSAREIERNNAIFARQGNRNPFIDNPSYVNSIWGGGTTTPPGGGGSTNSDLFISEYVEGSSNNKAIEIRNNTGASISLSSYQIKKQTNGAGSWSTGLTLSGTLANGARFVIVNSSIASSCYSITSANISTASGEMTFNGNDAIGLFKNGTLIDIVGTFNGGSANFAADVTLRRKSTATAPKSTYASADWDSFTIDTCSGLGNKQGEEKEITDDVLDFVVYPNPNSGSFAIQLKDFTNVNVEIYSTLGQLVVQKNLTDNNALQIENLNSGLYFVKISNSTSTKTVRVIVE